MIDMNGLYRLSSAKTRSISPENPTGAPGKGGMCPLEQGNARRAARDLGTGWKVNPYIVIQPKPPSKSPASTVPASSTTSG